MKRGCNRQPSTPAPPGKEGTMYLIWQDLDAKRPVAAKIDAARAAWEAKTHTPATVVRVSEFEDVSGVRPVGYELRSDGPIVVHRGCFYAGVE